MARTRKEQFLDAYEREHALTMKVLRAYPAAKGDLKPHARLRSARDLAWIFVLERGLGNTVLKGEFGAQPRSPLPPAPAWNEILEALEKVHKDFGTFVRSLPDAKLDETFKFLTGPKQVGEVRGIEFLWFLLNDQIHHRGQLSVYLRLADGKMPSIYGPSGDEPWM